MKFYRCETAAGPRLERTQLAAKALDPAYKPIDIPTDQPGLMVVLNDLLALAYPAGDGSEAVVDEAANAAPVESAPPPRTPPPPPQPGFLGRTYDQIGFEQFLLDIPDKEAFRLDNLADCIETRRREIAAKEAATT